MPRPTKRPGIVTTGNAGNSQKGSKATELNSPPENDAQKPLFPTGSKYPLSLLHERCQKNGWDKAIVDTPKQGEGFSFVVTLSKFNKRTSEKETVRLQPHPPYVRPTALEARHWGATYALYRFCNSIQLNRVLPAGPQDYWNELAAEHKTAPEHQSWMYDADPFAARKAVDERQAIAAKKREVADKPDSNQKGLPPASGEFSQAAEVKMAADVRNLVEDAVKKALSLYPEADDINDVMISEEQAAQLEQQLRQLRFTPVQARNAATYLRKSSQLTSNLLSSLSPLDAGIEYLVLHLPECDLPEQFLPSVNSSNPFVTAMHSGSDDLQRRWIEDKAVKEAGWPTHVVKQCTEDPTLLTDWALLTAALGKRLIGEDIAESYHVFHEHQKDASATWEITDEEVDALAAERKSVEVVMTLFSAPIKLHILQTPNQTFPEDAIPAMYITSSSVPGYVRLHLLAQLIRAMKDDDFIQPGERFLLAAMRVLEVEWGIVETEGPPDMLAVLQHLTPPRETFTPREKSQTSGNTGQNRKRIIAARRDRRTDAQIRDEFESMCRTEKFAELCSARQRLPAFSFKEQFLENLKKHRVVVIVGETGCGKTTQLPQFILDDLIMSGHGSEASIIVTQPRRLSAMSVAARVSSERLDDGSVGYAIRGESKQTDRTKLLFCTTGIILRRLGAGDELQNITHMIVDEVHERSVDGDFLLLGLKGLMAKNRNLKIILMSATINHESFVKYFDNAPLLTIPGFTYPVDDIYLEDVMPLISYRPSATKSKQKVDEKERQGSREEFRSRGLDDRTLSAIQHIMRLDRIDYQLVAAVVRHIITTADKRGGILVFLPGVQEIRQCIDTFRAELPPAKADFYPLHANLSSEEQRSAFKNTSNWKVIAATNVAETSITIDDVIYVVDCGKVKEMQYDPDTGLSKLVETFVSRASARQRRGRAGRTQPGTCYKLFTRRQETKMAAFAVPEILRVPLESICLTVKVMRESEDVKVFLSKAIDPPSVAAMDKALSVLEDLGAITKEGRLTALGRHMATLPVDLRLGKMLILGTIFRCLGPILSVAAILSSKPLFVSPMEKREEANQARQRFATGSSDLLTDLAAFDVCERMRAEGQSRNAFREFCEENFISATSFRDIYSLRLDFLSTLSDMGFVPFSSTPTTASLNSNSSDTNVLKAVILGGLWPRVANVRLPKSAIKFEQVQGGTVQKANVAKEFHIFDPSDGRVFLHPSSVLFSSAAWQSPFLAYFAKSMTTKIFLRDATEVPIYALLLFGGPVSVNHVAGGVTVGTGKYAIKLKAWPRIGILVNQLRRLLDVELARSIEEGTVIDAGEENPVIYTMLTLLSGNGTTM